MSDFQLFGYKVHLIVDTYDGPIEVIDPFYHAEKSGKVVVNSTQVLEAINEASFAPSFRRVQLSERSS